MGHEIERTDAGREYAEAHAAHYVARDLHKAVQLYGVLMATHPDTPEADYSWTQVRNIVSTVIPKQELQNAQMALVLGHFAHERGGSTSARPARGQPVRLPNPKGSRLANPIEMMLL